MDRNEADKALKAIIAKEVQQRETLERAVGAQDAEYR